ncbi:unnamed protein product [Closterium sp. NIES-54]
MAQQRDTGFVLEWVSFGTLMIAVPNNSRLKRRRGRSTQPHASGQRTPCSPPPGTGRDSPHLRPALTPTYYRTPRYRVGVANRHASDEVPSRARPQQCDTGFVLEWGRGKLMIAALCTGAEPAAMGTFGSRHGKSLSNCCIVTPTFDGTASDRIYFSLSCRSAALAGTPSRTALPALSEGPHRIHPPPALARRSCHHLSERNASGATILCHGEDNEAVESGRRSWGSEREARGHGEERWRGGGWAGGCDGRGGGDGDGGERRGPHEGQLGAALLLAQQRLQPWLLPHGARTASCLQPV